MSNSVLTVKHEDPKGLRVLVGVIVTAILGRLWMTGQLSDWVVMFSVPAGSSLSSSTYVILELIANLIYGAGTAAVLIFSGIVSVFSDVVSGVSRFAKERMSDSDASQAEPQPAPEPPKDPVLVAIEQLNQNMIVLHDRIEALEEEPAAASTTTRRRTSTTKKS